MDTRNFFYTTQERLHEIVSSGDMLSTIDSEELGRSIVDVISVLNRPKKDVQEHIVSISLGASLV